MQEKEVQYAEFVKIFNLVVKRYRLYTEKHPTVEQAIANFLASLQLIQLSEATLTLGFSEGQVIVNGQPVDDKKTGVGELKRECDRLRIESLIFERGVDKQEIGAFFSLMTMPPKTLEERGGFRGIFEKSAFQHIQLRSALYKKVEEDEEVIRKSEIAAKEEEQRAESAEIKQVATVERMEEVTDHCARGTEEEFAFDHERLAYELEKKTRPVAQRMVKRAQDLPGLRRIIAAMGRFLSERLALPFIEQGKDFSQTVSRLGREFKRVLEGPDAPDDFLEAAEELAAILERSADAIRLKLLLKDFNECGANVELFARKVARVLRSQEAWERLREPLKEKLRQLGVTEDDLERILRAAAEACATKRSREPEVSSAELAELRHIRDHFEEELAHRLDEKTAALEQDKRRAIHDRERVNGIIKKIGQALVVVDFKGGVQFMNPAAEKLLGTSQGASKGIAIAELLKEEHLVALAKGPLRSGAEWVTKEIELRSPNDETRQILQASSGVIENEDGEIVGQIAVLNDVTKQKRLDELRSRFIVNVTHELRTPLTAIDQSLGILLQKGVGDLSAEQQRFLSIAQRNAVHLNKIVNDVLDIAKLEAGKFELRPVLFNLKDVVRHAVEMLQNWIEDKRVIVEEKFPEGDLMVEADPNRLIQVMTNLLGNAIKFTPEMGRIRIEVDSNWLDPEISLEPCIAISVSDTGIGISVQDQERIFEKFEQGSSVTPHPLPGTGLGLALAKEIVELHGGKIWVESRVGVGSRFTFSIPRRTRSQTPNQQTKIKT